jgi:hypothetical protein
VDQTNGFFTCRERACSSSIASYTGGINEFNSDHIRLNGYTIRIANSSASWNWMTGEIFCMSVAIYRTKYNGMIYGNGFNHLSVHCGLQDTIQTNDYFIKSGPVGPLGLVLGYRACFTLKKQGFFIKPIYIKLVGYVITMILILNSNKLSLMDKILFSYGPIDFVIQSISTSFLFGLASYMDSGWLFKTIAFIIKMNINSVKPSDFPLEMKILMAMNLIIITLSILTFIWPFIYYPLIVLIIYLMVQDQLEISSLDYQSLGGSDNRLLVVRLVLYTSLLILLFEETLVWSYYIYHGIPYNKVAKYDYQNRNIHQIFDQFHEIISFISMIS